MVQQSGDTLPIRSIKVMLSRFELRRKTIVTEEGNPLIALCVYLFSGTDVVVGSPAKGTKTGSPVHRRQLMAEGFPEIRYPKTGFDPFEQQVILAVVPCLYYLGTRIVFVFRMASSPSASISKNGSLFLFMNNCVPSTRVS